MSSTHRRAALVPTILGELLSRRRDEVEFLRGVGDAEHAPLARLERRLGGGLGARRRLFGAAGDGRTRRHVLGRRPHRRDEHHADDGPGDGDDSGQRELL